MHILRDRGAGILCLIKNERRINVFTNKKINLPIIPMVPKLEPEELFEHGPKMEAWFEALNARKKALENVIGSTIASLYVDPTDTEHFIIVSPCTKGTYKYQLTKFDGVGPVYDCQRDDPEEIANEIPTKYVLADIT